MSLRRTRAILNKELKHILRDPRSLIMALAEPCLMLLIFGFALSLDVDHIPIMIFDLDRSPESRELLDRFRGSPSFEIRGYADKYKDIEQAIDRGDILMGIIIPERYAASVQSRRREEIQLVVDGSDSNTASIALGYASGLLRGYSYELRTAAHNRYFGAEAQTPVDLRLRIWYNSTLDSHNYIVPGLIAVILMIIAALLTSLTIAREWEMGTMEQLLSTPVRPGELVLGKMLAFFMIGVADAILSIAMAIAVLGIPFRGELVVLAVATSIFLFGALCWGIFLSAMAKTQLIAYQMGIASSFLPSMVLSGLVWSIDNMPVPIQALTHLIPARYMVSILKSLFLKGVGFDVLWAEIALLAGFALVVYFGATARLRQKMA
jgi:ABC-2 type transport system permease protein